MIINKNIYKACLVILLLLFTFVKDVSAQEIKKIAIMPFEIYSKADNAALRKTIFQKLTDELGKEKLVQLLPTDELLTKTSKINEKFAIDTGKSRGADFVIMGSMTQFGETISIDGKIINVHTANILPSASVQDKGVTDIAPLVTRLKIEILIRAGLISKIAKIEIKGNRKIESLVITQQIKSQQGKPFVEADITSDIKTIFKLGFFQDVAAEVTEIPEGKVITFIVQEKGLISEIRIIGNKALDRDDIDGVLTVKTRQTLNQEKIKTDLEKIKTLYDSKGYYNAEISDTVEKDGEKDFRIIINIKENDRLYVQSITFEGNEAYSAKELKNMMTTNEYGLLHFFTDSGLLKREQLKQDMSKLITYYYNNGFINAQISEPEITNDKKGIYIKIVIKEGKRFKIGKVEISGDLLEKPKAEMLKSLITKEGNNYDREAIVKDLDSLAQFYTDEGYADTDVNPKINIRDKEQVADVDFNITKGGLVYFNRITITGNTNTRDKVIRRQLAVIEKDIYSSGKLKTSYSNLNRLRYFEEIDLKTEKGPDKSLMDVNIRVKEKNTGMFMIGAGYSALDQAVVMAQITEQNFLGRGQILSLKASLGSTTNMYDASFIEPWLFDTPVWFKYDIWKYKRTYDSYTWDSRGTGITFDYPIWERIRGSIGYKISQDEIQDVSATASWYIKGQVGPDNPTIVNPPGTTISSSVTLGIGRDTTDDSTFPSKGTKMYAFVQQSGGYLAGDNNFTKSGLSAATFYSLPLDMVIAAKGRIGYIDGHNTDKPFPYDVPIFERYVLGGLTSIRGLQYVGIRNSGTSDALGGTTMLVINVELIFPFIKSAGMKGVVFYDTGNTWDGGYHPDDLRQTVGAGIRWYSPLGPLRLEYGYVLDRKESDSSGRWEFSIGMMM
ncbi:MAG: outer membrane protein assembly factor BamA [Smithellaceae bacterium]